MKNQDNRSELEIKPAPQLENKEQTAVERSSVEAHKQRLGTTGWAFAAARATQNWVDGQELTEAEYNSAISDASDKPA